ncbi:hypothetical protein APHAL10511_000389 [Amanita phalloides]|nr:hypothetical protein APHAL10511_000389 [Amanita phalloides]
MQQEFSGRNWHDAFGVRRMTFDWRNGNDNHPFLRDPSEFFEIVDRETENIYDGAHAGVHVPLDILDDYQYNLWDAVDSLHVHPISLLHWYSPWTQSVKNMLPEICHPHSQESLKIFGIPFPSCMQNIIVPPASEVDSWNNYYFVEEPDVRPYVAGLTCVPDMNPMESA